MNVYKPLELYNIKNCNSVYPLIILNQSLESYGEVVLNLWDKACFRVLTDGGANRFLHYLKTLQKNPDNFIPDLICGDFDSITDETMEFYNGKCEIKHTPDEDFTDFSKSLQLIVSEMGRRKINFDYVVAIINTSGRFDHIMGNIQALFESRAWTDKHVFLMAEKCITWLLSEGKHEIYIDESIMKNTCGLIPIGVPCEHVTTTGLKWNLTDHKLCFGGIISTSNTYDGSNIITVQTDNPLIWTMEIFH